MKKAIFFDLYDTLITEYDPNWKPEPDISPELPRELFDQHWSARRKQMEITQDINFATIFDEVLAAANITLDRQVVEQQYNIYLDRKRRLYQGILPEICETIEELKKLGYRIGLISNLSKDDFVGWKDCALANSFDSLTLSYEVGVIKPDPKIFQIACGALGVKPEECIYVGDGGSSELAAARSLGMDAYYASWFIEKWPLWKQNEGGRDRVEDFRRLESIKDLISIARMAR